MTNGDLETGTTAGWQILNPSKQPLTWGITHDHAKVHGGKSALSLTRFGGTTGTLTLFIETNMPQGLPAHSLVRTKIHVKTDNLNFNLPLWNTGNLFLPNVLKPVVVISDKSGNPIVTDGDNGFFQWTNPYTLIDTITELPPEAAKVAIQLTLLSGIKSGEVNVDDASIEIVKNLPPVRKDAILSQVRKDSKGNPRLLINGVVRPPIFIFGNSYGSVIYKEFERGGQVRSRSGAVPDEFALDRRFGRHD